MAEKRSKSNKKFMLLSAIGIFMVVDSHTWTAFDFFGDVIPYNSFFMPMFIMISGYFNKVDPDTKLWAYTKKKLKTLILPYLAITLAVFCMQWLFNLIKLGEWNTIPSGYLTYALEKIVTTGAPVTIATPMWFVISLFAVLMVYAVLRKILGKIWNSYVMFAIFTCCHLFVVYIAKNADPGSLTWFLVPLKVMFLIPFIEMGVIYRDHLEKKHNSLTGGVKLAIMFLLLLINLVRTMYLPNAYDVAFDDIGELGGFTSPYIVTPMISSIVGILFWLTLVDLIGKPLCESRFVNYMSCNTFWIMGFHIAFFNVLNCVLMFVNDHIVELPYFSVEGFMESEWYRWEYSPSFKIVYVLVGITGPLALRFIYDKVLSAVKALGNKTAVKT